MRGPCALLVLAFVALPAAAEVDFSGPAESGSFTPLPVARPGDASAEAAVNPSGASPDALAPQEFGRAESIEAGATHDVAVARPGEGGGVPILAPSDAPARGGVPVAASVDDGGGETRTYAPWSETWVGDRPAQSSTSEGGAITFRAEGTASPGSPAVPAARAASAEAIALWRRQRTIARDSLGGACSEKIVGGDALLLCGDIWFEKLMMGGRVAVCPVSAPAGAWRNALGPDAVEAKGDRRTYYFAGGTFYSMAQVGGGRIYRALDPPRGLVVPALPEGELPAGAGLHQFERLYFAPASTGGGFSVVDAPR